MPVQHPIAICHNITTESWTGLCVGSQHTGPSTQYLFGRGRKNMKNLSIWQKAQEVFIELSRKVTSYLVLVKIIGIMDLWEHFDGV